MFDEAVSDCAKEAKRGMVMESIRRIPTGDSEDTPAGWRHEEEHADDLELL